MDYVVRGCKQRRLTSDGGTIEEGKVQYRQYNSMLMSCDRCRCCSVNTEYKSSAYEVRVPAR